MGIVYDKEGKEEQQFTGQRRRVASTFVNFLDAVRSRNAADLNADILEGHVSAALCHLGNISYRARPAGEPRRRSKSGLPDIGGPAAQETFERTKVHLERKQHRAGRETATRRGVGVRSESRRVCRQRGGRQAADPRISRAVRRAGDRKVVGRPKAFNSQVLHYSDVVNSGVLTRRTSQREPRAGPQPALPPANGLRMTRHSRREFLEHSIRSAAAASVAASWSAVAGRGTAEERAASRSTGPSQRLGVAIIGAGDRGANTHLPVYSKLEETEILWIVDPDETAGQKAVEQATGKQKGRCAKFARDIAARSKTRRSTSCRSPRLTIGIRWPRFGRCSRAKTSTSKNRSATT